MSTRLASDASAAQRPATMKLQATAFGIPGEPGTMSEDAFRFQTLDEGVIAVLADGVGGSKEGGLAARRAVDMLVDYYLTRPHAWSPRRAIAEFAERINRVLFEESQSRHNAPELLCTFSVAAIDGDRLYGLNVGDSPILLWRKGSLKTLSQKHTLDQAGLDHVLTRAIGLQLALTPHVFELALEDGDVVLLCTDGVTTALSETALCAQLTRRASARSIVAAAREAVEEKPELADDASAVVLDVERAGWNTARERRNVEVLTTLSQGQAIDGYTLIRALQEDQRVWLAHDGERAPHVLKFPPLEARDDEVRRDAFAREIWRASRIQSPDFVRAFLPEGGTLRYYVMEYVEGPTLREALRKGPLRVEETAELGRFLARASQYLLTHDHAHGDIKPENVVLLRHADKVSFKLLDLGSAATVFSVISRAGTPSYLAPERFRGAALSERTEIFAIGVTLYEALARNYPYGEIERFQTPRFDLTPRRPTRINPATPPWLEAIVLKSIAPIAEDRYQNFSELMYDFEHPESVVPFYRKDAPLLERNPVLFYKIVCGVLLLTNLLFIAHWVSVTD